MAGKTRPARAAVVLVTALAAAACGDSPYSPTPVTPVVPGTLVLACPADASVVSAQGQAVPVSFENPAVQGATGAVTVSCSAPSGSAFPVGRTIVTCTAVDSRSASGQCSFWVTVRLPPPRLQHTRFLAFGDSLTEGVTSSPVVPLLLGPAESYPTRLQLLLAERYWDQSVAVINMGLSGELAQDGMTRLPVVLSEQAPEVLLLLEGANDLIAWGWPNGPVRAAIAVEEMIEAARRRGIRVFVATLPPWRQGGPKQLDAGLVLALNDRIRRLAPIRGATLVDLFAAFGSGFDQLVGSDGLHPTEAGYQRMAEAFLQTIIQTFEIPATR